MRKQLIFSISGFQFQVGRRANVPGRYRIGKELEDGRMGAAHGIVGKCTHFVSIFKEIFPHAFTLPRKFELGKIVILKKMKNLYFRLSISEAKAILKSRGHLAKLRTKVDQFHATLRKVVIFF